MKMSGLDQWAMELADYNKTSIHIKGSNNILADGISRLDVSSLVRCNHSRFDH